MTGVETDAVATGVTMVTADGCPEVSTVEDERIGTEVQDVDTVDADDVNDSVVLAVVTVCETLIPVQFVTDGAPPAV